MKLPIVKTRDQLARAAHAIARIYRDHPEGIMIEVVPYAPPKTQRQNGKLHVMIQELAAHLGYDREEFREQFKQLYGPRIQSLLDPDQTIVKSFRDLTREETNVLIETLYRLGQQHEFTFKE